MFKMGRLRLTSGLLLSLVVAGTATAQTAGSTPPPPAPGQVDGPVLEGPATELEPIPADNAAQDQASTRAVDAPVTSHDALRAPEASSRTDRVYTSKQPPAPISERPSGARPQPRAEWVSGYWDWDPLQGDFYWMGGLWQVPPAGSIWVGNRWVRDEKGWYRKPGFWSRRRGAVAVETQFSPAAQAAWRTTGPPADHPADKPAAAPGPDYFFIAAHYAPDGDQLKWTPGFWTRSQAGWDWIPARWVRRPTGWEFRAGHWVREPDAIDVRISGRPADRADDIDRPIPPPGADDERDPIAGAETGVTVRVEPGPVVVTPRMPYYVIRPPGMYPYGPSGVVVPGVVPAFVRDILNQVLP
jgi:hypothetical protein